MAEKTRTALPGAFIEKLPSSSVAAPVLVPSTITETPIRGRFVLSITFPVTFMFCANIVPVNRTKANTDSIKRIHRAVSLCETYIK